MAKKVVTKKEPTKKATVKKTVEKTKAEKKSSIDFDILNNLWNDNVFNSWSNYERGKGYFMVNRRLAIKHPLPAALLSRVGINTGQVINWWRYYMKQMYSDKPSWFYTKSISATEVKKEYTPSNEVMKVYCEWNDCSLKDINIALKFYKDEIIEEFKEIEDFLKNK